VCQVYDVKIVGIVVENTIIPSYLRGLRSQEMPRIAKFGVNSKTGVMFQNVNFKTKLA
jgi:hypothetical protein